MSTAPAVADPNGASAPFETIEAAIEYMHLLKGAAEESQNEIQADLAAVAAKQSPKRRDALRLINYKLRQLNQHLATTGRVLNDLRILRDSY